MGTIFMNSENSKTFDLHRIFLNLLDKMNLKRQGKYVALSNLSIYYTWENMRHWYKNNRFKVSALTWNEEFELPDGSYSVSDIQGYLLFFPTFWTVIDEKSINFFTVCFCLYYYNFCQLKV